jgi:hypothetical protein
VIIALGGTIGGWSVYAKKGTLKYCYNFFGMKQFYVESRTTLPEGRHQIRVEFAYDGGGPAIIRDRGRKSPQASPRPFAAEPVRSGPRIRYPTEIRAPMLGAARAYHAQG